MFVVIVQQMYVVLLGLVEELDLTTTNRTNWLTTKCSSKYLLIALKKHNQQPTTNNNHPTIE